MVVANAELIVASSCNHETMYLDREMRGTPICPANKRALSLPAKGIHTNILHGVHEALHMHATPRAARTSSINYIDLLSATLGATLVGVGNKIKRLEKQFGKELDLFCNRSSCFTSIRHVCRIAKSNMLWNQNT